MDRSEYCPEVGVVSTELLVERYILVDFIVPKPDPTQYTATYTKKDANLKASKEKVCKEQVKHASNERQQYKQCIEKINSVTLG